MKQVLLHIGTGKTGTTSIQHTMARAFKEKTLGNIAYPDIAGSNHNFLADVYRDPKGMSRSSRHRFRAQLRNNTFNEVASRVRNELREWIVDNDRIILSGEYFAGLHDIEIKQFCGDIRRWGVDKIRVLVYVRHPSAYYLSFIQQQLKSCHKITDPAVFRYRFREGIVRWQGVADDLVVRPFERSGSTSKGVVSDFLGQVSDFFGEVVEEDRIAVTQKNESISAEGMLLLQKYRFLFHRSRKNVPTNDTVNLLRILMQSQSLMEQTKPAISPAVGQLITEKHREDISWLLKHFQVDLSNGAKKSGQGRIHDKADRNSRSDLESILDCYDEKIFEELLFLCLHESLSGRIPGRA